LDIPRFRPVNSSRCFMKNDSLMKSLVGLLIIGAFVCALYVWRYAIAARDVRRLQARVVEMNNHLNFAQALLNDTLEYSKRNPAIDPLLQSMNLKPGSSLNPTNLGSVGK
jgi:hypothetical protein